MASEDSMQWEQFRIMQDLFLGPIGSLRMTKNIFGDSNMAELANKLVSTLIISGKTFASLNHSKQGFGEIYKIQKALGLLPEMKEKPKKSNEEAQMLRVNGNQVYKAGDLMEALRLYTKAICCAELEGEEIAMAYANRSAVTYGLQEYQNSIEDINRALSTGKYPENLIQKLFERRGKCFLALNQYKRALGDFKKVVMFLLESAIDADNAKVNSLKAYVDLIAECLGKQDIPLESARQPKLSHGPSSYIQSASAAVDIKYSRKMGRHIVASVNIAPGDILAIEKPFASVLNPGLQDLYCNNCKRRCHSSIPCASCNDVVFCTELCQETSWATHHSVECDILHNLNNLGSPGILALRTLLKATKLGENMQLIMDDFLNESEVSCKPEKVGFVGNMYLSDHYKATHNLSTLSEHLLPEELLQAAVRASLLVHVLKEATTFFEHSDSIPSAALFEPVSDLRWNHIVAADLLMRYIMVSACNSYHTQEIKWKRTGDAIEGKFETIGGATYAFGSLWNHSCNPDVLSCHYNGDTLIIFAVKPITKGQQIFINYGPDYAIHDKLARQNQLRLHCFTCECTACLEDWPLISDMHERNPKFVSARAKKRFQREIAESCGNLPTIFMAAHKGNLTEKQFRFLTQLLTLIHENVKQPWEISYLCQRTIGHYIQFSFNPCILNI